MDRLTKLFFENIDTEEKFNKVKSDGMLWEYYPESSGAAKEYLAEREMWLNYLKERSQ